MNYKVILILFLVFLSALVGLLTLDPLADGKESEDVFPQSNPTNIEEQDTSNVELEISGWIPDWGASSGLTTIQSKGDVFHNLSPVWYEVNSDGSLINKKNSFTQEIEQESKNRGIKLYPTIAMFDHVLMSKVLSKEKNIDRHVDQIVTEVINNDYDGIDLDYESIKLKDKDRFFKLVSQLSKELDEIDKDLIITVLAKWGDNVVYPSLRETREVQDWTALSEYVHKIRIMSYDFTFAGASFPGPIAPIDWVEDILEYAVEKVPREKLVLGIHLYSYEWYQEVKESSNDTYPLFTPDSSANNIDPDKQARSYEYRTVKTITRTYKGELIDFQGEKIFSYQKFNDTSEKLENRMLVFIDPDGVEARKDLAKKYGISGVVYWRLGGEEDLI